MIHNSIKGFDCRHFVGEKPCRFRLECPLDSRCKRYTPQGTRILIIKLGAIGDALRTTPILPAIRNKSPGSYITWLTDEKSYPILEDNNQIDRLLTLNLENSLRLQAERFDLLISLDKDVSAISLASLTKADEKLGFGLADNGSIYPLNLESEYIFRMGFSDRLKFYENQKTYQQLIFEALRLDSKYGEYLLHIPQNYIDYGKDFMERLGVKKDNPVIGLNTGAGKRFATKRWSIEGFAGLAKRLNKDFNATIILLGGPEEMERNNEIALRVNAPLIHSGCNHSLKEFIGILNQCDLVVTGDTLALHLAIGLKKSTVAIFTSTCAQEIDLYGRGEKITSNVRCTPCYLGVCNKISNPELADCVKAIKVEEVFNACKKIIEGLKD